MVKPSTLFLQVKDSQNINSKKTERKRKKQANLTTGYSLNDVITEDAIRNHIAVITSSS